MSAQVSKEEARKRELVRLFTGPQRQRIVGAVSKAVRESFGPRSRAATSDEIAARTNLATDLLLEMKVDCHLSLDSALDHLLEALIAKLLRVPWEPPKAGESWGVRAPKEHAG